MSTKVTRSGASVKDRTAKKTNRPKARELRVNIALSDIQAKNLDAARAQTGETRTEFIRRLIVIAAGQ